jgi:hypothetical protein
MSAEAVEPPEPRTFENASPREIRAALIPEEQADFDITWRAAVAEAAETMDLDGVFAVLDSWRAHAMITDELGHAGYRRWLAQTERIAQTGEPLANTLPLADVKALLRERLGL